MLASQHRHQPASNDAEILRYVRGMPSDGSARRSSLVPAFLRTHGVLLLLVAIAIGVSFAVRHEVFGSFSWNRDEPVYLWQTRALLDGQLTTTDGGAPQFFQPWLVGAADGRFFSQYTPGWPVALAVSDVLFGDPGVALALASALAVAGVFLLAREMTRDRTVALVAAAVMTASPILVLQSGMYLGYLFSLGLGCCFGTALLVGLRRNRRALLAGAGALLGLILLTRPLDAVLWAAPFAAYLTYVHRKSWSTLVRPALWVGAGFGPLLVLTLAYNAHVTGSPTEFPITATDPLDTFGFGIRRIMPLWTPVNYTVERAFRGAGRNLFYLPFFAFGAWLGVVAGAVGLWLRRRDRTTLLLLALGASFPIGYFFFWGIYLSGARVGLTGPIYYIPLYAPLSIFIATAVVGAWRHRRAWGIGVVAALVVATIPFLLVKADDNRDRSVAQAPWRETVADLDRDALIFVEPSGPYLIQLNPYSTNAPDLDGRLLYATERGPENLELIAARSDRVPYRQSRVPAPVGSDAVPEISLTRLEVVTGERITVRAEIRHPGDDPVVVAYLLVGDRIVTRTVDMGPDVDTTATVEWSVAAPGIDDDETIPLVERLGAFSVGFGTGASEADAIATHRTEVQLSYRITDATTVEVLTPGLGAHVRLTPKKIVTRRADVSDDLSLDVSGARRSG